MAVNFYDVNFNQTSGGIPAISGYIIDDEAYAKRSEWEGTIPQDNIISKAQSTSTIPGAISMDRYRIDTEDGQLVTCRLAPDGNHCIYITYTSAGPIQVTICDAEGVTISQLVLPQLENADNISLVGHFNTNDELDWCTVGYMYRGENDAEAKLFINVNGWPSSIRDELKPYVYLKYKYNYQVVIQKSLRGSNDFQISRFPRDWFDHKIYGTGEGQSRRFNEVVCRLDPDDLDIYDQSAAWWRYPPVSTAPSWWNGRNVSQLLLDWGLYLESSGYSAGSDITRLLPTGQFYNGLDGDNNNLAWRTTVSSGPDYDIAFSGGTLRLTMAGGNTRHLRILDADGNVLDDYELPYPVSGGASAIPTGQIGQNLGRYDGVGNLYIAENNGEYFLIGLKVQSAWYNDDDALITLSSSTWGSYTLGIAYQILHKFNADAKDLLFRATDNEKIVPADPDELTGDDVSNQTTDPEHKTESGEEIPVPKYSEGEWGDGTSEGIRGSGTPQATGENSERQLDRQPALPGLPSIPTASSTGFMKLYAPTDAEITALRTELTQDTVLNNLKKYFGNNPLDFIIGLQVVPGTFTLSTNKYRINYGSYSSNVAMNAIADEMCELDYGTLDLKEIYASWEDYNPHTKMSIYLPYLGIKDLDPDRVNGTELHLKYYIDATTGSILARLTSKRRDSGNEGAEYLVNQWAGQAAYTIPVTNVQHDAAVNAVISIVSAAVSVGAAVATSGASMAAQAATAAAVGSSIGNAALSGAHAGKTDITMQGSVSGSLAFFTGREAYVTIEYPREGRPDSYDHIVGMPSNIRTDLKHQPLNSYIEFVNVDVSGLDAPADEKQAIVEALRGGIYT